MAPLDAAAALPDISADQPAGENLEFDSEFAELERLAQGKPEQQYGATVVPAEEPEWKDVLAAGQALMARTYDLRVMSLLAVARLQREGVTGYLASLDQIRHLLETRWDAVHPQLDPEDDNDPMLRSNALLRIADPVRVLRVLRIMPLARSVRAGTVCWRDISITAGTLEVGEDTPKMAESVIAAAFREVDPGQLQSLQEALEQAAACTVAIPAAVEENAGFGTGPDFTELTRLLREMARMVATHRAAPPEDVAAPEDEAPAAAVAAGAAVPAPRPVAVMSIATMGPPTNRTDATRLLELVIEYYERFEPSSPLPLLIGRARRLAEMGFMDILRDLAPDGVSQAELVAGRSGSE